MPERRGISPETQREKTLDNFVGVWPDGIEHAKLIHAKSGNVALGTDIGGRDKSRHGPNEDRLFFDTDHDAFAVVDGMGGYEKGGEAAQIVSETIQQGVAAGQGPQEMQRAAWQRMKAEHINEGGAVYFAGQLGRREVKLWYAGDAGAMIVDAQGRVKYRSPGSDLADGPGGFRPGKVHTDTQEFLNHDLLVVGSDGFWENLKAETIIEILKKKKPFEALSELYVEAMENMKPESAHYGNKDNITLMLYQRLPESLRGK